MLSAVEKIYTPAVNPATRSTFVSTQDLFKIRKQLVRTTKRVCPNWLSSHVEDITQDALMKLADTTKHNNSHHKSFSFTFLNRVAINSMVDQARKNHRSGASCPINSESSEEEIYEIPTPIRTPEQEYITVEVVDEVRQCFLRLAPPKRTAVNLYLQGHTVQEICTQQGWTEAQATNFVYRGLATLRCRLKKRGLRPS